MAAPGPEQAGEARATTGESRPTTLDALWLAVWAVVCALSVFWSTIGLPYAFDDLAQLERLADFRAGRYSLLQWLRLPHNEHTLPLLRLLFAGATSVASLDASVFRLAQTLLHASGAVACGLLVAVHTRSRVTAWVAATAYAGAAGFSGSVIWSPTISVFGMAGVGTAWALAILALRPGGWWRSWWTALGLVAVGSAALNTAPVGAAGLPAYCLLAGRRPPAARWLAAAASYGLLGVVTLGAAWLNYRHFGGTRDPAWDATALLSGVWIVYTAPLKFAAGWVPLAVDGVSRIAESALVPWSALAVSLLGVRPEERRVLLALWAGPVALALLVGVGRSWIGLGPLYMTDRYYYAFLLPLAAHVGFLARGPAALVARWSRPVRLVAGGALLVIAGAALAGSRLSLERTVPWLIFDRHARAWERGAALADLIAAGAETGGRPRALADGVIPFDGVSQPGLRLLTLVMTRFPAGLPNVRITATAIGPAEAAAQNRVLAVWATRVGLEASPVRVEAGRLRDVRQAGWLDFRRGAHAHAVVSGFHGWDTAFRWTSGEATLRLTPGPGDLVIVAAAPIELLRRKWPGLTGVPVTVHANGTRLAEIVVTESAGQTFRIPVPPEVRATAPLVLSLRPHLHWRPVDVDPRNLDSRTLGVAVLAVGFPDTGQAADAR